MFLSVTSVAEGRTGFNPSKAAKIPQFMPLAAIKIVFYWFASSKQRGTVKPSPRSPHQNKVGFRIASEKLSASPTDEVFPKSAHILNVPSYNLNKDKM